LPGYNTNPTNIDIYNCSFYDSEHDGTNPTGYIYLTDGVNANIYNCLFNLPNSAIYAIRNIDDYASTTSTVRILNCTFVADGLAMTEADEGGANGDNWPSHHGVQAYNNLFYDFSATGSGNSLAFDVVANNTNVIATLWKADYNDYKIGNSDGYLDINGTFGLRRSANTLGGIPTALLSTQPRSSQPCRAEPEHWPGRTVTF